MTFYTKDAIGDLDQGDILTSLPMRAYLPWFEDIKLPLVVVTPTCDLAQEKTDFHRLCVLHPLPHLLYQIGKGLELVESNWKGTEPLSKTKWAKIQQKLTSAIKNAWPRYHFLPSETGIFETDYIIDFEIFATVPLNDLRGEDRYARINAPFKQEIIQRLASYMMRIGTPDLAASVVTGTIDRCIKNTGLRSA